MRIRKRTKQLTEPSLSLVNSYFVQTRLSLIVISAFALHLPVGPAGQIAFFLVFLGVGYLLRVEAIELLIISMAFPSVLFESSFAGWEIYTYHLMTIILVSQSIPQLVRRDATRVRLGVVVLGVWAIGVLAYLVLVFLLTGGTGWETLAGFLTTLLLGVAIGVGGFVWAMRATGEATARVLVVLVMSCSTMVAIYLAAWTLTEIGLISEFVQGIASPRVDDVLGATRTAHFIFIAFSAAIFILATDFRTPFSKWMSVFLGIGVLATGSRSVLLACAVGLVVLTTLLLVKKTKISQNFVFDLVTVFGAGVGFFLFQVFIASRVGVFNFGHSRIIHSRDGIEDEFSAAVEAVVVRVMTPTPASNPNSRLARWSDALSGVRPNEIFFGSGFEDYWHHNAYLTLLLGLGILGFSLLILPVLLPIISLFREINLGSAVTVSAMLGVLTLYIFTDGFSSPISYLLLGVLLSEVSGRRITPRASETQFRSA